MGLNQGQLVIKQENSLRPQKCDFVEEFKKNILGHLKLEIKIFWNS